MNLVVSQFDGLLQGQNDGALKYGKVPLTKDQLYHIAMQADMNDLLPAFSSGNLNIPRESVEKNLKIDNKESQQLEFLQEKECSGFVRFNKETNDLISSHSTHNLYVLMNRIFKNYNFNFKINNRKLNTYKFSSRPGDLNSKDDYYTLSNNMVVLETSLHIYDLSLYKNLKYDTVPKWIRINIANRLAQNNLEWIELFFKHNSGTHNNQWLIVDYNKFEEYLQNKNKVDPSSANRSDLNDIQQLIDRFTDLNINWDTQKSQKDNNFLDGKHDEGLNIIHLVEQIPVLDKAYFEDFSNELINEGYVASYNAPYFPEVIELAGYKSSNHSDYFTAHRNFLFKKFADQTNNVDETKILMRFHDKENMCDTIAPRCDVVQNRPFGSVDAKITDRMLLKKLKSVIINGPPHIKGVSEPFDFSKYSEYSHLGIPEYFDFNWIEA